MCGQNCSSKEVKGYGKSGIHRLDAVYTEDDITEDTEVLFDCGEHEQTFHYCPCCGERIVTEDYYFDEDELSRSDIEKEWNSDYMRMAW